MIRVVSTLVALLATIDAGAGDVVLNGRTLRVADGFDVEVVAAAPLVERPIAVSTDEKGRLYVTDSGGMSEPAAKQLAIKLHRIRRLEDTNGDGVYDKSTLFADKQMFPEGCLYHRGSLYVAAPPQIWRLTDADDDGVAERREVWFDGGTLTGCGNDLHGPYLGPDGYFYWCKGAFAEQKHAVAGGKPFVSRASHIFRARTDGSGLEAVLTGGMDNPVNVAFLSTGERILSCTFFQHPAAGRRDGLIHAIYGGVYGKKHDVLQGHAMTGDVMPVLHHSGASAPCGLIAGTDHLWGGGYADQLLACYFNLRKVVRHELIASGATYRTRDADLLACDHPDFHPTDVFEDADGSVLVVDTGGWYKVCCPTSVLAKPDMLGAIYRVRKRGAARVDDPRGERIAWDGMGAPQLAGLLGDSRPVVRRRATERLREFGIAGALPIAAVACGHEKAAVRRAGVWALAGIDAPGARDGVRAALADADPTVRHAAAHVAGVWRDAAALSRLLPLLSDANPGVARAAAEAVGRIGDASAVMPLLEAIEKLGRFEADAAGAPADEPRRVLEHSFIHALIEIRRGTETATGLISVTPAMHRAALVALDQMRDASFRPKHVIPLLESDDPILKNTATWIVGHRPDWGSELVDHFRDRLVHPPAGQPARDELAAQIAPLAKSPAVQALLAAALRDSTDPAGRQIVLRAMADARLATTPTGWLDELSRLIPVADASIRSQAVATARGLPLPKAGHADLAAALTDLARRADVPAATRVEALLAAGPIREVDAGLFDLLVALIRPAEPFDVRSGAATVLAKAALTADQRLALAGALKDVSSLELPKLLAAFERGPFPEALGLTLLDALAGHPARAHFRPEILRPVFAKYPDSVWTAAGDFLGQLDTTAEKQAAHLDELAATLPKGDVRRGHAVFLRKETACVACHTLGYQGGRLGPDMTHIGKTRNDRDLLEAIVYPSASFVRGYEPVILDTADGDTLSGIVTSEAKEDLTLATGPEETRRVLRSEIRELRPGSVSPMPQGFETTLSPQDLADLIAFLRAQK